MKKVSKLTEARKSGTMQMPAHLAKQIKNVLLVPRKWNRMRKSAVTAGKPILNSIFPSTLSF
ncbi:MAG TPA: hypothetical protein VFG06_09150 [Thermodesulfovibrionales bacterium]|nr:hypothetical protein [Thermodesulfovibrionales bacterium]